MKYIIDDVERILKQKDFDIFIHGCNSKGKFRSGIAGIVRKVYPEAAQSYERYVAIQGLAGKLMGKLDIATVAPKKHIVNAITQESFGYDGGKYASYDAVDEAFRSLANRGFSKGVRVYYPLIGCGLGGLKWNIVSEIIDHRLSGLDHYCIVREQDARKYDLGANSPVSSYSFDTFDFGENTAQTKAEIKEKPKQKEGENVTLWLEGYAATGESGTAHILGYAKGNTLEEAIEYYKVNNSDHGISGNSIWGCRIFDNEDDARKSFG